MKRFFVILLLVALAVGAICFYFYEERSRESRKALTLYGNVDVRQVEIGFRVTGRVIEMPFEEGDLVEKDVLMARLDRQPYYDQVQQGKATIESARVTLTNAEKLLARRRDLLDGGGVSVEDYDNAVTSRDTAYASWQENKAALGTALTNLRETEVFAPIEGTILTRIREPGSVVNVGDPIYTLSILSPVWVRGYVSEGELGLVYPGMKAEIHTDTVGAPVYRGHVGFISPVAEFTPKTVETTQLRSDLVYRLRIIADNPDKMLKQGMPVTVILPLQQPLQQTTDGEPRE